MPINIEIKAHCQQPEVALQKLKALGADYKGIDHQIDTYFNVGNGRLKLREGNIENNLIFYQRGDQAGPKTSQFELYPVHDPNKLKSLLSAAHGVKTIVDKKRHILFVENVKFHIDEVKALGHFIEIEASNLNHPKTHSELQEQCERFMQLLEIGSMDLIEVSYSDLLLQQKSMHEE